MTGDLEARLRARVGAGERDDDAERPRSWSPKHADDPVIVGRLVDDPRVVETRYGRARVAVLETRDGLRSVWITPATLRRAWTEAAPRPGDRVGVAYEGERTSKDGRTYGMYAVDVESDSAAPASPRWGDDLPF